MKLKCGKKCHRFCPLSQIVSSTTSIWSRKCNNFRCPKLKVGVSTHRLILWCKSKTKRMKIFTLKKAFRSHHKKDLNLIEEIKHSKELLTVYNFLRNLWNYNEHQTNFITQLRLDNLSLGMYQQTLRCRLSYNQCADYPPVTFKVWCRIGSLLLFQCKAPSQVIHVNKSILLKHYWISSEEWIK